MLTGISVPLLYLLGRALRPAFQGARPFLHKVHSFLAARMCRPVGLPLFSLIKYILFSEGQWRLTTTALSGLAPARSDYASAAATGNITAGQHDDVGVANYKVTSK
jgi:hypothetical protein